MKVGISISVFLHPIDRNKITIYCELSVAGAAYGVFAGHDASRGLATFQLDRETIKDEYDDLSDLTEGEREQMMEWQMQFSGKKKKIIVFV